MHAKHEAALQTSRELSDRDLLERASETAVAIQNPEGSLMQRMPRTPNAGAEWPTAARDRSRLPRGQ